MSTRNPVKIKVGDQVRLRKTVSRMTVPEGRQDHKTARVLSIGDQGELHLDRDLNGARWWNRSDVQIQRSLGRK